MAFHGARRGAPLFEPAFPSGGQQPAGSAYFAALFGSYKYQGEWGLLDHIILSGNLLTATSPLYTAEDKADVFHAPFLLTEDKKYGDNQPFRTYYGMKYQAGYSDHLPVWAEFRLLY